MKVEPGTPAFWPSRDAHTVVCGTVGSAAGGTFFLTEAEAIEEAVRQLTADAALLARQRDLILGAVIMHSSRLAVLNRGGA